MNNDSNIHENQLDFHRRLLHIKPSVLELGGTVETPHMGRVKFAGNMPFSLVDSLMPISQPSSWNIKLSINRVINIVINWKCLAFNVM